MTAFLIFIVSTLACYRLSHMLASELGPVDIFKRLRAKFSPKTNLGKGVRCSLCLSVHCAAAITAYLWWIEAVTPGMAPLYFLGVTGGAVLIHKLDG